MQQFKLRQWTTSSLKCPLVLMSFAYHCSPPVGLIQKNKTKLSVFPERYLCLEVLHRYHTMLTTENLEADTASMSFGP